MNQFKVALVFLSCLIFLPIVLAEDGPHDKAIKARQSMFQLYSFSMGTLGGMAKEKIEYNAEAATAMANNLHAVVNLDQSAFWPPGSDNANTENATTRALPVIWETYPAITEKNDALKEAVEVLANNAGNGLDALQGAIGDVGNACKGCHDDYRAEKK